MGCGQRAAADSYNAEASWRTNLGGACLKVHEARQGLEQLGETLALTREQFKHLEDAIASLDQISGNQKYW